MIRRFFVIATIAALLMFPDTALAQKGGRSHGASHGATASKSSGASKPVHVKAYTKKDGTTVAAHDRKAPTPGAARSPETATGPTPIRVYRDPVTGVKTFTNAPMQLPSRALATTTAAPIHRPTTIKSHATAPRRSVTTAVVPRAAGATR